MILVLVFSTLFIGDIYFWKKYKDNEYLYLSKYTLFGLITNIAALAVSLYIPSPSIIRRITFLLQVIINIFVGYKCLIFIYKQFKK